ncbi:MAG: ABC transporter permease, partial [Anaerotignum sp.]|nr:ABC transporter permease [Anaerotignum sp.]
GGIVVLSQLIGGVLSGMGGAIEVLGRFDTFLWRDLPGYGWTGITVAILAKNNPIFVPIAAFFISYLNRGCTLMATYADVPAEMADIIQAVVFLFFAAEQFLAKYRQKLVVAGAKKKLHRKMQQWKEVRHNVKRNYWSDLSDRLCLLYLPYHSTYPVCCAGIRSC